MKRVLSLLTLSLLTSTAFAVMRDGSNYTWNFASGQPWPGGYQQATGKPQNMTWAYPEYPAEFFQRIANALPERRINEAFLTDDQGSNITLNEEAEVFVTFVHEGAGYKNSFGYFTFDANNPPTNIFDIRETIVFPNLSYPHLTNGHRVSLGTFPAGTSIGFFIAANGFWYNTGVKPFASPYYYSIQSLNPESDPALKQHNVLLYDEEVQEVIIGFEDLPRTWGDNDFNDAVFAVSASPASAIASDVLVPVPEANDSDADGVPDSEDEFPNDFRRVYSSYFPSATHRSVLAYEDTWPRVGDLDLNDLVVSLNTQLYHNAQGQVTGLRVAGDILARGASYANGFALRMRDIPAQYFRDANITVNGKTHAKLAETGQQAVVVQLWRNTSTLAKTNESGKCSHFNTVKTCSTFDPVPFDFTLELNTPLTLNHSQLDFFLFRTNYRGREIHFADVPPTDKFDTTQFGKFDDTSDASQGRYFKTQNNLPWALRIDDSWRYPQEYIQVNWAYPAFIEWIESSGTQAQDWYLPNGRIHHYY